MPEYKATLKRYYTISHTDSVQLNLTATDDDNAEDLAGEMAYDQFCIDGADLDDIEVLSIVCLTPPVQQPERLTITRPDGSTYTCYGTYEAVVAVTQPEPTGTQGTRVTDPVVLPNGRTYRPYAAVERNG